MKKARMAMVAAALLTSAITLAGCGGGDDGSTTGHVITDTEFRSGVQAALDSGGVAAAVSWISLNLTIGDTFITSSGDWTLTDIDVSDAATNAWLIGDGQGPMNNTAHRFYDAHDRHLVLLVYLGRDA